MAAEFLPPLKAGGRGGGLAGEFNLIIEIPLFCHCSPSMCNFFSRLFPQAKSGSRQQNAARESGAAFFVGLRRKSFHSFDAGGLELVFGCDWEREKRRQERSPVPVLSPELPESHWPCSRKSLNLFRLVFRLAAAESQLSLCSIAASYECGGGTFLICPRAGE